MSFAALTRHLQTTKVAFDPTVAEHMEAFKMLAMQQPSQQHPTLRFELEFPFVNVLQMMYHKVAIQYMKVTDAVPAM